MVSNRLESRHLPMIITMLIALTLTLMPLPEVAEPFRPDWALLFFIYWAMLLPHRYSVGIAWIVGLLLDVAQGTLLGQHALAMCAVIFITVKFHLLMRVFPLLQLTAAVGSLLATYQFLLFWINGVAGVSSSPVDYWGPVVSGTLLWPLLSMFMNGLRFRQSHG